MDLGQKPFVVERQVFCSAFRVERYEDWRSFSIDKHMRDRPTGPAENMTT